MQAPKQSSSFETWLSWCNENYPFDRYIPNRQGLEVLRGIEDPRLRVDVAQALTRANKTTRPIFGYHD